MDALPVDILSELMMIIHTMHSDVYKAAIGTYRKWYKVIKNATYEHSRCHVLSSLIMRHPTLKWNFHKIGNMVSQSVIYANIHQIQFSWIRENPLLSTQFIENNIVGLMKLSKCIFNHPQLTMSFIYKLIANGLATPGDFVQNPNLTHAFIRENWDQLDIHTLVGQPSFTMDLITEYSINPDVHSSVSSNPNLTPEFIRVNWDELDFHILTNPAFTMELVREFEDEIGASNIFENPNIDDEFIYKYFDIVGYSDHIKCPKTPIEILDRIRTYCDMSWGEFINSYFTLISRNINLTLPFIINHAKHFNWLYIVQNRVLTLEVAEANIEYIKESLCM